MSHSDGLSSSALAASLRDKAKSKQPRYIFHDCLTRHVANWSAGEEAREFFLDTLSRVRGEKECRRKLRDKFEKVQSTRRRRSQCARAMLSRAWTRKAGPRKREREQVSLSLNLKKFSPLCRPCQSAAGSGRQFVPSGSERDCARHALQQRGKNPPTLSGRGQTAGICSCLAGFPQVLFSREE